MKDWNSHPGEQEGWGGVEGWGGGGVVGEQCVWGVLGEKHVRRIDRYVLLGVPISLEG